MNTLRRRGMVAALVTAPLIAASVGFASASASAAGPRSVVPGARPAWAAAANARGPAAGSQRLSVRVWLALRDAGAVRRLAAAVSNPASPDYGHYLTPAQFESRYAPTAAQVAAVARFLSAAGLTVTATSPSNRWVQASGNVSAAEGAFAVRLENYAVRGRVLRAPAAEPSVPSALAGSVLGITGLDNGPHMVRPAGTPPPQPPPAAFVNAPPFSNPYGSSPALFEENGTTPLPAYSGSHLPWVVQGYTPPQFRSAYGVNGTGLTGAGTTVAITDAYYAGTIVADANTYAANHDPTAPTLTSGSNFQQFLPANFSNQGQCSAGSWPGEETLDVEAVHGLAPAAGIDYFASANCLDSGFIDDLQKVDNTPGIDVVSNSWSGFESTETASIIAAYEQVFQQGIIEGRTFVFSSGDDGDELAASGTKQVDYPPSDPYVTAAGGTSIGLRSDGSFAGQTGWGTDKSSLRVNSAGTPTGWGTPFFLYGAGGGFSAVFARPSYQNRVVSASTRGVPDVSMDADPNTGMLVGETQDFGGGVDKYGEYRIGGTSLAAPLFSAALALADQQAHAAGRGSIAEANNLLYTLYRRGGTGLTDVLPEGASGTLPDIGNTRADYANSVDASNGVLYSVRLFGDDSSLTTTKGWDDVTGTGTINGSFYSAIANLAP